MIGNVTLSVFDLMIWLGLVAFFTVRGVGGMGPSLRQFSMFMLDKAPAGIIDLFDKKEGNAARNWMILGSMWFCVAATLGFLSTWLRYDPTALDSLANVGWSYDADAFAAVTNAALFWGGFSMVLIGAGLVMQSRMSGSSLASEANGSLVAFGWSTLTLVSIILPIFIEVGRFENTIFHLLYGTFAIALLLNHMLTLSSRDEAVPITAPAWLLLLGHSALCWGLFANAAGHFTQNTQLEWIAWSVVAGWFPMSLILATMMYSAAKASGAPLWSGNLSMATVFLLFISLTPFAITESSSASGFWVSIGAIAITMGMVPILATSANVLATLKGRWECLVDQPAAACAAASALLLPAFAVGAYFTALDTFAGAGGLADMHATVNQGVIWVVGGLAILSSLTLVLPLVVGREIASRSRARWAFWMITLGGLGWTIASLMGDFAQKALTDAGAEGDVGGFYLTASVFLYILVMGVFSSTRNAVQTCFNGALVGDVDTYSTATAPAAFRLTAGSTSIRSLLGRGVGMDTEILFGNDEAEEESDSEPEQESEPIIQHSAPEDDGEFPPELVKLAIYLQESNTSVVSIFSEMDINEDGQIDHYEFREGLAKLEVADLAPWDMDALVNEIDLDKDDRINLPELDILMLRIHNAAPAQEADLSKLKKAELVELCEQKGLSTKGTKAVLIERLSA